MEVNLTPLSPISEPDPVIPPYESGGDLSAAEAAFKKAVPSRYYSGVSESSFAGERYPRTIRSVLSAEINHRLGKREAGTEKTSEGDLVEKVELTQVLFFTYRDGTRMLTLGWFVDDAKSEKRLLDICKFQELSTYRNGAVPLSIKPPVLTPLEIRALNSQLPCSGAALPTCPGLSAKEIEDYSSLYRYFPVYFEVAEA